MLIKRFIFIAVITVFALPLYAQTGTSLEAEIQNIERTANRQGAAPAERHQALVRLARLRQLSGDIEGAARNWLEAAGAVQGQVDDDALLSCAYCLAAMGEWDRARAALEPLLVKSARARFLNIGINAISTGNNATLAAVADNPEYSQMKSEIFFLLWKTSRGQSAESWKSRLASEFPQSPEGRLAAGNTVAIKQNPFWLFAGGLDSLPVLASETAGRPAPQTPPANTAAAVAAPAPAPAPAVVTPAAQSQVKLQTGLYGRQANAQTQAANLRQAGFSPSIEQRTVNNNQMWAVTVPAGADMNRTIAQLREAGFESFPLR
jgi:hypothetical protein